MIKIALFSTLVFLSLHATAAIDAYPFPNDELRARYQVLIAELRCPQCLNTNLAGSDAMIAKDLRREVHRLLLEGKNDEQVLEFMHARYGDFILYEPRTNLRTLALWLGPLLLLIVAFFVAIKVARGSKVAEPLSAEEQARLNQLLGTKDD